MRVRDVSDYIYVCGRTKGSCSAEDVEADQFQ
jgi:hypothetical protein